MIVEKVVVLACFIHNSHSLGFPQLIIHSESTTKDVGNSNFSIIKQHIALFNVDNSVCTKIGIEKSTKL